MSNALRVLPRRWPCTTGALGTGRAHEREASQNTRQRYKDGTSRSFVAKGGRFRKRISKYVKRAQWLAPSGIAWERTH
jgi:hypothetical protein